MLKFTPDDYTTFRRNYETPILKSRMPDRTESEKELGEARNKEVTAGPVPLQYCISNTAAFAAEQACQELCVAERGFCYQRSSSTKTYASFLSDK